MEAMGQIAAVAGVLALLPGVLWWLKRRGLALPAAGMSRRRARHLECLERVALAPQQSLLLLRLGNRILLVGTSPAGCSLLREFASSDLDRGSAL